MRLVAISDTHCQLSKVEIPEGDVLVHSGDLTYRGTFREINNELIALSQMGKKFNKIILISGNHDFLGEKDYSLMEKLCNDNNIEYLHDSSTEINGLLFYGSPFTPFFNNWAFNLPRGEALKEKWDLIPEDTDVLITHGPPYGILDGVERWNGKNCEFDIEHVGCEALQKRVFDLKQLKLHIFGHIHGGYGTFQMQGPKFVNASICTEQYKPTNVPIVIDL